MEWMVTLTRTGETNMVGTARAFADLTSLSEMDLIAEHDQQAEHTVTGVIPAEGVSTVSILFAGA